MIHGGDLPSDRNRGGVAPCRFLTAGAIAPAKSAPVVVDAAGFVTGDVKHSKPLNCRVIPPGIFIFHSD